MRLVSHMPTSETHAELFESEQHRLLDRRLTVGGIGLAKYRTAFTSLHFKMAGVPRSLKMAALVGLAPTSYEERLRVARPASSPANSTWKTPSLVSALWSSTNSMACRFEIDLAHNATA